MSARAILLPVIALSIAVSPARAQVRDGAPATTGTGVVAGTVVTEGAQPRGVRRAVVTLNSGDPFVARTTITDDAGRFIFANVPAGRYTINATKRSWTSGSYGAKAIGRPGRPLQLGAGERAAVTIKISPGGVISGTILDQFGQPITGLSLRVMRYSYTPNTGERRLNPAQSQLVNPDERGAYRIYSLSPGEYYLSATTTSFAFQGGRDLHLTSEVDVDEALKAAAAGPAGPIVDVPQPNVGFAQVYYPGVTSVAQATPIVVRAGEERSGIDFAVQYATVAHVEGTLLAPDGRPTAGRVTLVPNDPTNPGSGIESLRNAQAGEDGRFTFSEVAPGPYLMSAHVTQPPPAPGDPLRVFNAVGELDVQSANVTGVSLMLQDGAEISGIVQYDGAAPAPNFSSVRVLTYAMQTGVINVATGGNTTASDGKFKLPGLAPGRYRLSVGQQAPIVPWTVRSITIGGQDALDGFVDVRQSVADAVITLTDRIASLTGKMDSGTGTPADYTVVLFSIDRAQWRAQSRRILTTRTATDGSYTFRAVPPGDYFLAPVEDAEPGEWYDPAFLQRLSPGALRITIAEGEQKVQDVKAGGF
jgi:protocatechuate 3,4-dioxygenase beta subunit